MADAPPSPLALQSPAGNALKGIAFMLAATLSNATMSAMVRGLSDEVHPFEIAFFRCFFGLFAFAPFFLRRGLAPLRTSRFGLHLLRGGLNVLSMLTYFMALSLVPLATVAAIDFSGPLFATVLAVLFLGEVIRIRRIVALVVGFAGGLVILRPGFGTLEPGMIYAVVSAFAFGITMMVLKRLTRSESSVTITLYMGLLATPFALIAAIPVWASPTFHQLLLLAAIGVNGTVTLLCFAQALHEADTTTVTPVIFTRLLWAAMLGYAFFGEVPDIWTWIGGSMIFLSVTYITIRERRVGRAGVMAVAPSATP